MTNSDVEHAESIAQALRDLSSAILRARNAGLVITLDVVTHQSVGDRYGTPIVQADVSRPVPVLRHADPEEAERVRGVFAKLGTRFVA